jgi:sigma-B regulation protein RsbU (phosphoserine phosphatase)
LESEVAARTTELSSANDRLKTLNDRFQSELSIARKVQQNLLPPHHPNWNLLDMVCHSQAAEEVGGDFYTYYAFPRNNNAPQTKYGLAVGDVSGKGMPAALLMAISLASFQSAIAHSADPVEMMVSLDEALAPYTYSKQQNCALCYVEVTRNHLQQNVTLQAINAGCIAPIVRRKNGHAEILNASGLPLGSISNSHTSYEMVDITLKSGELIILTSDGVVEATNAQGDLLGFDRLLEIIEAAPTSSAQTMLDYLQQSVSRFIGQAKAHDDLTIMVIRV